MNEEGNLSVSIDAHPKKLILPPSHELKEFILNLKEPTVIHAGVSNWALMKWNLNDWSEAIKSKRLPFRTGKRQCNTSPQWERTCGSVELSLDEFIKSTENEEQKGEWMYFDYKYMSEWFKDQCDILQSISWKQFGFPEVHGEESTMWLGTEGAHTPCHSDSYSLNIVAQIYGRCFMMMELSNFLYPPAKSDTDFLCLSFFNAATKKMWVMFPPESTNKLQPTRVPYEESSVYSKINFYCGYSDYSKLDEAYFVVLEPGDVLIVPNQWWHYVENLSTAISINTWIPLETDDEKRLEECLVRNFISSSIKHLSLEKQKLILNPNEDILLEEHEVDMNQLSLCVERCKIQHEIINHSLKSPAKPKDLNIYKDIETVKKLPMTEVVQFLRNKCKCSKLRASRNENLNELGNPDSIIEDYINAFCSPDIIKQVKQKLMLNKN